MVLYARVGITLHIKQKWNHEIDGQSVIWDHLNPFYISLTFKIKVNLNVFKSVIRN